MNIIEISNFISKTPYASLILNISLSLKKLRKAIHKIRYINTIIILCFLYKYINESYLSLKNVTYILVHCTF